MLGLVIFLFFAVLLFYATVAGLAVIAFLLAVPAIAAYVLISIKMFVKDPDGSNKTRAKKAKAAAIVTEVLTLLVALVVYLLLRAIGGQEAVDTLLAGLGNVLIAISLVVVFTLGTAWILGASAVTGYGSVAYFVHQIEELFFKGPEKTPLPVLRFNVSERAHKYGILGGGVLSFLTMLFVIWAASGEMGVIAAIIICSLLLLLPVIRIWVELRDLDSIRNHNFWKDLVFYIRMFRRA